MNRDYTALPLVHNTKEHQFELTVGEHIAFLEYRRTPTALLLMHTQVPPPLEDQGVATTLIEKTLTYFDRTPCNWCRCALLWGPTSSATPRESTYWPQPNP
jgi:hypothetical protein